MARKREFDEAAALRQAMELFWVQGYEKTSMDDLVTHMGVHRKSIYDTFGNKNELFLKVLENYQTKVSEQIALDSQRYTSSYEKIRGLFDYAIRNNEVLAKGCLIVNTAVELALHDEAVADRIRGYYEESEKYIYQLLQQGQVSGEFSLEMDTTVTSHYIHNALIGIRVQLKTSKDQQQIQSLVDMILQVLKR